MVGTTAPGIVARTGQACTVDGAEHYFECLRAMQCAAAPIRDVHGRLAGVLDLSVESRRFGFDAASMVALYATTIENRLLLAQSRDRLVLRFQANPTLLGTPLEALAGIAHDGTVAWLNAAGARLIGGLPEAAPCDVELLFGLDVAGLLRLGRREAAQPVRLASGLGVWLQARTQAQRRHRFPPRRERARRSAGAATRGAGCRRRRAAAVGRSRRSERKRCHPARTQPQADRGNPGRASRQHLACGTAVAGVARHALPAAQALARRRQRRGASGTSPGVTANGAACRGGLFHCASTAAARSRRAFESGCSGRRYSWSASAAAPTAGAHSP